MSETCKHLRCLFITGLKQSQDIYKAKISRRIKLAQTSPKGREDQLYPVLYIQGLDNCSEFSPTFVFFQSQGLNTALTSQIMADIQRSIRQKDEEMSWLDACCLHFAIKGKAKTETYTFQTRDPNVKKEWIVGEYNFVKLKRPSTASVSIFLILLSGHPWPLSVYVRSFQQQIVDFNRIRTQIVRV